MCGFRSDTSTVALETTGETPDPILFSLFKSSDLFNPSLLYYVHAAYYPQIK